MKLLLKILLDICIVILAFFLGRASNVCVTSSEFNSQNSIINSNTIKESSDDTNGVELIDINNHEDITDMGDKYLDDTDYMDNEYNVE